MRAIVNTGPGTLEMRHLPTPVPGPGEVRIRTAACGICATELSMIAGWARTGFPAIPGHEWSGTVDAVGPGVDGTLVDRRVVGENVLSDGMEVGFEHPGGYGEFLLTEARNLHTIPDSLDPATAALVEPLAVVGRGVRRIRGVLAGRSLVMGDGPIGLLAVVFLRHMGERVSIIGGSETKLALAEEMGAEATLDCREHRDDLLHAAIERFGRRFPTIVEASGSVDAIDAAMRLVAKIGTVLTLSDYGEDATASFRWLDLLHNETSIVASNASEGAWSAAVRLAIEESSVLNRLITHRFPAEQFAAAFDTIRDRSSGAVKVALEW